ncbi:MAG: hypothetical protein ACRETL_05230, partial [Gammaproteobacteria bacterium]
MNKQYFGEALAAFGCCVGLSGTVWAQLAPVSPELQEIVVTAEKRVSTVQKTPISMTVFTGADLK